MLSPQNFSCRLSEKASTNCTFRLCPPEPCQLQIVFEQVNRQPFMWRGCQRINGFDLANQSGPAPLTHQWEALISINGRGCSAPRHTHTQAAHMSQYKVFTISRLMEIFLWKYMHTGSYINTEKDEVGTHISGCLEKSFCKHLQVKYNFPNKHKK